jgi:hypothetical protein
LLNSLLSCRYSSEINLSFIPKIDYFISLLDINLEENIFAFILGFKSTVGVLKLVDFWLFKGRFLPYYICSELLFLFGLLVSAY